MSEDLDSLLSHGSIGSIGQAIRRGQISAAETTEWFLSRINALNGAGPKINAVREISRDAVRDARAADNEFAGGIDRGALHGIPVLLKDNILTDDGMKATAGAAALRQFQPNSDAELVRRLRQAGAIILGKANMTEFADFVSDVMPSEFSAAGGVVRNPHGPSYGRGQGSSVGPAASVAAQFAPVAIGTETQNSIQAPAIGSSVFGFKPTVGYVSRHGVIPLVTSQDSPGPITRTAMDAAIVLAAISGPDVRDSASLGFVDRYSTIARLDSVRGLRIGVLRRHQADRPEFSQLVGDFERVLSKLSSLGAVIVDPCDLPAAEQIAAVQSSVFRSEFKSALNAFLSDHRAPCGIASLEDLIAWNEAHPDEIPYGQSLLIAANGTELGDQYRADRTRDMALSRAGGIEGAIRAGGVDVLVALGSSAAKCSGKAGTPVAAIPVGAGSSGAASGITLHMCRRDDARLLAIADAVERAVGERLAATL